MSRGNIMKLRWIIVIASLLFIACDDVKIVKDYYPSGELKAKYRLEDGELHGTYYEYYKSGGYKEQSIYQNGKLNGWRRVYFENGLLNWEAQYKDGKANGIFKNYYENGNLLSESVFKNDVEDSVTRWYYPDGSIEKELQYKDGHLHGIARFYYENGQIRLDAVIDLGTTIYYKRYSESGVPIQEFRDVMINMPDTVCTETKFTIETDLMGPELVDFEAIFEVASNTDFDYFEITFNENKYRFDTVINETGRYIVSVNYWLMGSPYISLDSIYVVDCDNMSNIENSVGNN